MPTNKRNQLRFRSLFQFPPTVARRVYCINKQARPCQDGMPLSLQRLKFSFTLASPRALIDIATAGVNKAAAISVLTHEEDDNPPPDAIIDVVTLHVVCRQGKMPSVSKAEEVLERLHK